LLESNKQKEELKAQNAAYKEKIELADRVSRGKQKSVIEYSTDKHKKTCSHISENKSPARNDSITERKG
jgi:hypothetical protein